MQPTNYVKLSIRGRRRYSDRDSFPNDAYSPELFVTTWIFPFVEELENDGQRALAAAEAKCDVVAALYSLPVSRFRFVTWLPSRLGLDVVCDESEAA